MNESKLKLDARELAEAMHYVVLDGSGRNGAADKIFLREGRGFVVEFKIKGGVQSDDQKIEERYCTNRGVPYYLCWSLNEFRDILLKEERKQ